MIQPVSFSIPDPKPRTRLGNLHRRPLTLPLPPLLSTSCSLSRPLPSRRRTLPRDRPLPLHQYKFHSLLCAHKHIRLASDDAPLLLLAPVRGSEVKLVGEIGVVFGECHVLVRRWWGCEETVGIAEGGGAGAAG